MDWAKMTEGEMLAEWFDTSRLSQGWADPDEMFRFRVEQFLAIDKSMKVIGKLPAPVWVTEPTVVRLFPLTPSAAIDPNTLPTPPSPPTEPKGRRDEALWRAIKHPTSGMSKLTDAQPGAARWVKW